MISQQGRSDAALAMMCVLLERDEELVGDETLVRLLECARNAVGAASAHLDTSGRYLATLPVERFGPGTVTVTSPHNDARRLPVLVIEGCPPTALNESQSQVLRLCGSLIGSVVRATERDADRERRRARQDAVHAVATSAVEHIDLDVMLLAAVEALRLGVRCQGVAIRAFDSPDPASLRRHSASYPSWAGNLATEELLDISGRAARICWDRQCASIMSLDDPDVVPLTDEAERDFMLDWMRSIQARSLLMAPLGGSGECQGFIALTRTTVQEAFDDEDAAAVLTIGRELGNAVVHTRLFARQRVLVEELQELHNYKDNFVATVAHQLKSPLTSILGHVELLEEATSSPPEAAQRYAPASLPVIRRGAERIQETVEGLLTLSKVQLADRPLIAGRVRLVALVKGCAELVSVDARERGVTVDLEHVRDDSVALGDHSEIEKVVDNLLSNAVKYSRRGGKVTVATYDQEDGVVLECRDEGYGIDAEDLTHLFEPFYRSANSTRTLEPGTGLGMTIIKSVVDRHRGKIDVESVPSAGTTVRVWLPSPAPGTG